MASPAPEMYDKEEAVIKLQELHGVPKATAQSAVRIADQRGEGPLAPWGVYVRKEYSTAGKFTIRRIGE